MDIKELRDKTAVELERMLAQARNRLRELRFKVAAKQLADVREIRETRKLVAQIMTLIKPLGRPAAKGVQGQEKADGKATSAEAGAATADADQKPAAGQTQS